MKKLFTLSTLIVMGLSIARSSYEHVTSAQPDIFDFRNDYARYIQFYGDWAKTGMSHLTSDSNVKFSHQIEFKLISQNQKDGDDDPHTTIVKADRFFMNGSTRVNVASDDLRLPHIEQDRIVQENPVKEIAYFDSVIYQPIFNSVKYFRSAVPLISGLNSNLSYTVNTAVLAGTEIEALAFTSNPLQPDEGFYHNHSTSQSQSRFIFSKARKLNITHDVESFNEMVNSGGSGSWNFRAVSATNFTIKFAEGYRVTGGQGFLPEGLYENIEDKWYKIKKDFSKIQPPTAYIISHPSTSAYIAKIEFGQELSNDKLLSELDNFFWPDKVQELNLSEFIFSSINDQRHLNSILIKFSSLNKLNLSKKDKKIDYTVLLESISKLAKLKVLNITNGLISDESLKKLAPTSELQIINIRDIPLQSVAAPKLAEPPKPHLVNVIKQSEKGATKEEDISDEEYGTVQYINNYAIEYYSDGSSMKKLIGTDKEIINVLGKWHIGTIDDPSFNMKEYSKQFRIPGTYKYPVIKKGNKKLYYPYLYPYSHPLKK